MEYPIEKIQPSDYPEQLLEIPQCPKELYSRGSKINTNTNFVAIVGARHHTDYGKKACQKIIRDMAPYPITIVSGLALGIDAIAHQTALEVGLPTIAIIGSGLDDSVIYPATNIALAHQILKNNGTLISELPPQSKATKYTFPSRNRIMAGLSKAVIAIECGIKSGTRITTRLGLEYNKEVGAIPHNIFSEVGMGTNALLKQGAHCIQSGNDIIELLGIEIDTPTKPSLSTLTPNEKKVYESLSEPKTKTELTNILSLPPHTLQATIALLEMKSLIVESMGKIQKK